MRLRRIRKPEHHKIFRLRAGILKGSAARLYYVLKERE